MRVQDAEAPLSKPFYDDGWSRAKKPHAKALWDFHSALVDARAPALDGEDLTAYFEAEREKVFERKDLNVMSDGVFRAAYEACTVNHIPIELLGRQIAAARRFKEPIRFADARKANEFIREWACSHGRALAHLADASGSWQLAYVDELSTAFFWVGRLVTMRRDLELDRLFIPQSDLDQADVTIEQLREGRRNENTRRLFWKQSIRAKDAFAQSEQLAIDLPRRYASALKRAWLGGLEVLNEIARRDYDLWSRPISLSVYHRSLVRFQARFGRTSFR
ncbi:MAG: squalene/phytoene synthase family protein, partial [Rhodothermales bacterium]